MNGVRYKREGTRVCGEASDSLHPEKANNLLLFTMKNLRPREVQPPAPGYTAGMDKSQDSNPGLPNSKA